MATLGVAVKNAIRQKKNNKQKWRPGSNRNRTARATSESQKRKRIQFCFFSIQISTVVRLGSTRSVSKWNRMFTALPFCYGLSLSSRSAGLLKIASILFYFFKFYFSLKKRSVSKLIPWSAGCLQRCHFVTASPDRSVF